MSDSREETLRSCALLREFSEVGLKLLAQLSEERKIARGLYAFRAGEPSTALAVVGKGTLQLQSREGSSTLGEIQAGDTLGGMALLSVDSGEHLLSAFATADVELVLLQREAFETLQKNHPRAALKLTLAIARDLAERVSDARAPLREFLLWQVSKPR